MVYLQNRVRIVGRKARQALDFLFGLEPLLDDTRRDPQPHDQFLRIDRFGQEIVHPGFHPDAVIFPTALGRLENEESVLFQGQRADPLAQFQAVHLGHHPVTDHDRRLLDDELGQRLLAVARGDDFVSQFL